MALYKLKPLLKAANCTSGWEKESYMPAMQLFKAKLLETYIHTKNFANNQHFPTSRRLEVDLGLDTTFVNRKNTNEFVLKTASEFAGREVLLFLDLLLRKRAALAGHILRTNDRASLKEVAVRLKLDPLKCFHKWQKSWRSEAAVAPLHYLGKTHRTDRARHRTTNATNRMALTALAPKSQICRSPI